jgi:hypothetical protein
MFETTFIPFLISSESSRDRVRCKLGMCWSPCQQRSYLKTPIYSTTYGRISGRRSRTRRTLGSHQIQVFRRRSEQLVGREARRELKEALAHVLGAEASPEYVLTVDKHRPSRLTIAELHCRFPPMKVSINTFPSSL